MSMTLEQIVKETSQFPPDVVAELVDRILVARHGGVTSDIDQSWKRETRRRVEEIQSGKVTGVPGDEVSARLAKRVGR
jgi:putative addiction module component (TIGR02574 family)